MTYLYKPTLNDADERNQLDLWTASLRQNILCSAELDKIISDDIDSTSFVERLHPIVNEYGYERILWVLANTVKEHYYHGAGYGVEEYVKSLGISDEYYNTLFILEKYTDEMLNRFIDLTRALALISDYVNAEFGSSLKVDDLSDIGITYTTITEEEYPLQVSVDLVGICMRKHINDVLVDERHYDSILELIMNELQNLDFYDLISYTDDQLNCAIDQDTAETPEL